MSSTALWQSWMRGVAANPAAPSAVLRRLLTPPAHGAWKALCSDRPLPADVVDAALAHREPAVRRCIARNRHVAPAQRGRLASDPDPFVRAGLASGPPHRRGNAEPLPDQVLEILLTAKDDSPGQLLTANEIAQELVFSGQISHAFRRKMPGHAHPALRVQATVPWLWLTPAQRDALLSDPDPTVREAAHEASRVQDPAAMEAELPERDCHARADQLTSYAISRATAEQCLAHGRNLRALAHNPHTPGDVVATLARDTDPTVRACVAGRADLTPELLSELTRDPDPVVRTRAQLLPLPRTWAQRAAVDRLVRWSPDRPGPLGDMFFEPPTRWYQQCATSEHPLLRRVAATSRRLTEEVVARLADDPDPDVRCLLALHHPLAPPRLLLDTFVTVPRQRDYLRTSPRLPRTGLRHLLEHEDPEVRALAAADLTLPDAPLHLLADPDLRVRRAATANPLLPGDVVEALLVRDPESAEAAASNSRLPVERLHELLDACGLTRGTEPAERGT